jgi:hypothetical protein
MVPAIDIEYPSSCSADVSSPLQQLANTTNTFLAQPTTLNVREDVACMFMQDVTAGHDVAFCGFVELYHKSLHDAVQTMITSA